MSLQCRLLNFLCKLLTLALLAPLGSLIAHAQSKPCGTQEVPSGLEAVSAALGICAEVEAVSTKGGLQTMEALKSNPDIAKIREAAARPEIAEAIQEGTLAVAFATDKLEERAVRADIYSRQLLKYSGIVIGGVGAGVGGGLRLVNNKSVMHDGTVVGMAGGIAGAAINLFVTSQEKISPKTKSQFDEMLDSLIKQYLHDSDPALTTEDIMAKPSMLAFYLMKLKRQTRCLRLESPEAWTQKQCMGDQP